MADRLLYDAQLHYGQMFGGGVTANNLARQAGRVQTGNKYVAPLGQSRWGVEGEGVSNNISSSPRMRIRQKFWF